MAYTRFFVGLVYWFTVSAVRELVRSEQSEFRWLQQG